MGMKKSIHIFALMEIMGRRAYLGYIVKLLHLEPEIAKFDAHKMDICSRWQAWIVVYCVQVFGDTEVQIARSSLFYCVIFAFGDWSKTKIKVMNKSPG